MNDLYSGPPLDRAVFEAASVPAGTVAATERLRREGAIALALSAARILELLTRRASRGSRG